MSDGVSERTLDMWARVGARGSKGPGQDWGAASFSGNSAYSDSVVYERGVGGQALAGAAAAEVVESALPNVITSDTAEN